MWCCCEDLEDPAEDTGTLWIDVDVTELGDGVRSGTPHDLVVTHWSLVLTEATAGRPAWRRLVETMDREIRAAEFDPAPD